MSTLSLLTDALSLTWWGLTAAVLVLRVVLYVALVSLAWYAIIEEHVYSRRHQQELSAVRAYHGKVPVVKTRLGDGIHTTQPRSPQSTLGGGRTASTLHRTSSSLTASTDMTESSDASSVADWSIWDGSEASDPLGEESDTLGTAATPAPAFPADPYALPGDSPLPPVATPHLLPTPDPPSPAPSPSQPASWALPPSPPQWTLRAPSTACWWGGADVAPAAVGAAGADAGDAAVLHQAGASMAGGDIVQEPAKERVRHTRHGRRKKEKKPYLVRKMEKWVYKPIHDKYEKMGFMTYKGFGRMGRRFERGLRVTGAQLSTAMNTAGLVALESVDHLIKKWVMFVGVVAGLSFALLPLPSSMVLEVRMVPPV